MYPDNRSAADMIYLVACAVNRIKPDADRVRSMDSDAVYQLACAHSLCAAAAYSMEAAGVKDARFSEYKAKSIRKAVLLDVETQKVFQRLSARKIWHCPLKGAVIKSDYPSIGMREMSDHDVLCDPERMADVRAVMEEMGYSCTQYEMTNQDVYEKPPSIVFEMHRTLFEEEKVADLYRYFLDIKGSLIPAENSGYTYYMTPEDNYLYLVAHSYKHYIRSGTGLRALVDVYVYLNSHKELNMDLLSEKFAETGLSEFERNCRQLAFRVFSDGEVSEEDREGLAYFLSSGTYGNAEQFSRNRMASAMEDDSGSSKIKYLGSRFRLSDYELRIHYPFFDKHRAFLPLLYVFRFFRGVFCHPKKLIREVKDVKNYKKE